MTNALTTTPTDNFAAAAEASQSAIVGERIRFSKGLYLIGRGDGERLPPGTVYEVHDVQAAWVKFIDGKVVDQHIGYPMPDRDDLDDTDEAYWPIGMDGKPADPWSNQRYLYLIDPETGAEYTFVTSSWGGRSAVEALARQVFVKRQPSPGAIAIVRLEVGYKRSQRYGNVPAPKFVITGWRGVPDTPPRDYDGNTPSLVQQLNDEIPF